MRQNCVRLLCFLFVLLSFLPEVAAQNCGQRDTIIFLPNSSTSIDLEISEYFNNDLSDPAQGLCAIELGFVHQFVENFELSLTSPGGQTVGLFGPNSDDPLAFTPGTQWNISLVNCATMAEPDSAFTAQWNNDQTENWVPFGNYTGSYYPFGGCLEDFNTGPVNGTWTFNITNDPSNNPGAITYIRLIFCDSRGVECCFAVAGEWQNEDIRACVNADTLLITPDLNFPEDVADTTEYAYAFLIGEGGIYQELDSLLDFRTASPGEYDICGFSYRRSQLDSLPLPDGVLTLDSIRSNLEGLEPWLCAELTPDCLHLSILPPPDTTRLTERICRGDSVLIGMQNFEDSGFYTVNLLSEVGCDSIVTLDLFVQEVQFINLDSTICPGDTVFVGTEPYFETGIYQDTLPTIELGCDSIITLDLTVLSQQLTELTPVICAGEEFMVGDSTFTTTGQYQVLLTSVAGCDSLVSVDLLVLNPQADISGADLINCASPESLLSAVGSTPLNDLSFQWLNPAEMVLGNNQDYLANAAGSYILEVAQLVDGTTCLNRDTFTVTGNFATPVADPGTTTLLTCTNDTITIGGPGTSTGPPFIYEWTSSNGNITGPLDETLTEVSMAGTYQLIVQDTFSFCRDTALVEVTADQLPPAVITEPGFTLNCLVTADTLDGSASFQPGFILTWTGPCILSEPSTGLAIVDCPGWYYLDVLNTATGCQAVDSVFVSEDLNPALAQIAFPDTLTCANPTVTLDGSTSTPAGLLDFGWLGPNGETSENATFNVTASGTYELIITRQDNFCRDTAMVIVQQDTISPVADIGTGGTLSCAVEEITLGGTNTSSGSQYAYLWYQNGTPIPGSNSDTLSAGAAATYVLEVTDTGNGCSSRDTIMIAEDFLPPEDVEAGPDRLLSCGDEIVLLVPDSTIFSRPVSWEWTADCIAPFSDTWTLATDCPGIYTLTVTNIDNGCQGRDTVRVNMAPNFSLAVLPDTILLSCVDGTATLDNSGSIGSVFNWLRDDINISLPNNQPVVDQPGIYTLIASDLSLTCSDTAQVAVIFDCQPIANIASPDTLTCSQQSVILDAASSITSGPNTYRWEGPSPDCFVSATDQVQAEVVCPGEYRLIIEHTFFGESDTSFVTVLIDTITPQVEAGESVQLTCGQPSANLMGTVLGPTDELTYAWTNFFPGDTLVEAPNYSTQTPGTYRFFARNNRNGCIGSDIVQVTLNNVPPIIAFGSNVYPCEADSFLLQAFINPPGNNEYTWTGPEVLSATDSADVWIGGPGMYTLSVFNTLTECSSIDSILVIEQTCIPCLELSPSDTLNCITTALTLEASFCRLCIDCTLQWADESGPLAGEESLTLDVMSPGTYTLTATDTLGFSSSVSSEVILLDTPPLLDLGPDRFLSCDSTTVQLSNQLMNDPDQTFTNQWSELTQGILAETGPTLTVDEEGTFILLLTNPLTGCTSTDTLIVIDDQIDPIADAGPNQEFTCQSSVVILDGSASTSSGVSYEWSGPNDACLSGADTNMPIATCSGLYTLVVTRLDNGCSAQDTVRVTINEDIPELQVFPDTVLTCTESSITLVSMPLGAGSFSTSWCALDTDGNQIPGSCAFGQTDTLISLTGQYEFSATNTQTGCSNSFVVTVGIDTLPPIIDAGPADTLDCTISILQLNAQVPVDAQLNWTGPIGAEILNPTSSTPTVNSIGWYVLEATSNSNSCVTRDSVQIFEDADVPVLNAGPDTLINCLNPTILLAASGTTVSGAPSWSWETTEGLILADSDQPTPSIGATGWYYLTLTDSGNNCSTLDSVFVGEDFRSPTAAVLNEADLFLNCFQDTLLLDGSSSISATGEALSYSWTAIPPGNLFPDLAAPSVFTDRAGDYQLTVIDEGNGCRDTLLFSVDSDFDRPDLEISPADPLDCVTFNSELTTIIPVSPAGFDFLWTNAANEVISTTQTANAATPGWYYLTLTDQSNGCPQIDSVLVSLNIELPEVSIVIPEPVTCEEPVTLLDGSASAQGMGIVYEWSSNSGNVLGSGSNAIDSTSTPGTYRLMVTDTLSGCSSLDSVIVTQSGQPIIGIEVVSVPPPCVGTPFGSISIDGVQGGTPPYEYRLNQQDFSPFSFYEDLLPGTYNLEVIDANGCLWSESILLQEPDQLDLDLGPDQELLLGDSIQLKPLTNRPISTWAWNAAGLLPVNAPYEPFVRPTETQFIVLSVVDDIGCIASDTLRLFVEKLRPVFIPTAFSPDGDGENDRFTIYGGQDVVRVQSLRVFSRWGNMVFEQENFAPNDPNLGWDGTLWGEPLNAAVFVYYAEILFTDGKTELITGDVLLMR